MAITSLGYLGIRSDKTEDWQSFAGKLLGLQEVDHAANTSSFRMDDYKQRLVVSDEIGESLAFIGWEVEDKADLLAFADKLNNAGHEVEQGSRQLADQRFVEDLIVCHDPAGNRIELFCNPETTDEPFISGRPISGFITGPVGMGHAVLHVTDTDVESLLPFYRDLLGFAVSDYGLTPIPMYFFHVNERHHSFAIIGSGQAGFHHFMLEYQNLDDVGQGFDLAQLEEGRVAYTLGRHTNDYMTSYYAKSPSGFFVESGWGGRLINPAQWQPHETHLGPSFWGHERLYLPDEIRDKFRAMRLKAAANGLRTPSVADCPWLYNNFWQDSAK